MENQKILLVTGKGGVGKSTVAAAAALKLAREGNKVLLAEVGEKSFYKYLFDKQILHQPRLITENLWACRWEGEECLKEYIAHFIKIEKIVSLFFENKVMKALIQAAPALKELAIIGKLTSGIRQVGPKLAYDYIVLDAYSTGHFKALVQAPQGMGEAIPVGPMGEQCRSIDSVIKNPEVTRVWIVALPEELPVTESLELAEFLETKLKITPQILLNRMVDSPLSQAECQKISGENFGGQGEGDFLNYLCEEVTEQNRAREELKKYHLAELPNEYLNDPIKILDRLAEKVPDPWSN